MKYLFYLALFFLFCCGFYCDDGLCSAEGPPQNGGSCSGDVQSSEDDHEEKDVQAVKFEGKEETEEEKAVWEKLAYRKLDFTDDYDWQIRHLLDENDDFIGTESENAISRFQDLLKDYPESNRAYYALTRAMQFLNTTGWDEDKLTRHHQEIYDRFLNFIQRENLSPRLYHSAVHNSLLHSGMNNNTEANVEMLKIALKLKSFKNEIYQGVLLQDLFTLERFEEGLQYAEAALEHFYWNKQFKFFKGLFLKKLNRKKEANALLRDMEAEPGDTFEMGSRIIQHCDELTKRGRLSDVDMIYKEASKIHLFMSRYQRPLDFSSDLESKPIWSLENDVGLSTHEEEIQMLKENWQQIKNEALGLRANHSLWFPVEGNHLKDENGSFEEYPIVSWGKFRQFYCKMAPVTCKVLKQFKAISYCKKCVAKFNVLPPKSHILPRTGPSNKKLRLHMSLQSPQNAGMRVGKKDRVEWTPGSISVFDDSYEHELWNKDEKEERILLSIDIPHPEVDAQDQLTTAFNRYAKQTYEFF